MKKSGAHRGVWVVGDALHAAMRFPCTMIDV